jgi:hypothetical protein
MSFRQELKQAKIEARLHPAKKKPMRKPPTRWPEAQPPPPTAKARARLRRTQLTISRQFGPPAPPKRREP